MTLKLYNTLTRTKEQFTPLDDKNIRVYVCGPTVYDHAHIGNARPVIVFDVLFRLLRHLYGENHVTYARNITDVDDKINKRAFERWTKKQPLVQEIRALTDSTLKQFHNDIDALGVLRPTHEPRATDYIARGDNTLDMVKVISRLVEKGNAYEAEGHVLFSVPSMPNYGGLSRRPKDDMIAGARVEIAPYKRDPMDFVLWKPSNPETEPGWDSPWGYGRPGWHIECSAMSGALFGDVFDIHGGGLDLIFPHHENEIAQSCCYSGQPLMANYWMHNGFLQVEGEKMSKSLGNFVTINEVLRQYPGSVLRLLMLETHYRQPIDWTLAGLERSRKELLEWAEFINAVPLPSPLEGEGDPKDRMRGEESGAKLIDKELLNALNDDLNTPLAISRLREIFRNAKRNNTPEEFIINASLLGFGKLPSAPYFYSGFTANLVESGPQIQSGSKRHEWIEAVRATSANGMIQESKTYLKQLLSEGIKVRLSDEGYLHVGNDTSAEFDDRVQKIIDTRIAARVAKNFAESDRLRDELVSMGIELQDGKDVSGAPTTSWKVKG